MAKLLAAVLLLSLCLSTADAGAVSLVICASGCFSSMGACYAAHLAVGSLTAWLFSPITRAVCDSLYEACQRACTGAVLFSPF